MLASELITDIRTELLEPVAGFFSSTELLTWINPAQVSTVAGQATYELPANWLSAVLILYNDRQNGVDHWYPLEPTDLQRMSRERPNFLSTATEHLGKPCTFAIWDRTLILDPTPDTNGDGNVRMFFKSKAVPVPDVNSSINIDDTLAGAIRAFVLWKAWSKEKELALAAEQKALYDNFVRDGLRWVKLQALSKRHQIDVASAIPYSGVQSYYPL
jgi:hypothetical protein